MTNSTIARLQALLVDNGYDIQRLTDTLLVMPVTTTAYRNPKGRATAAFFFTTDRAESLLTVDVPWAFDGSKALHKDALHRCLLVAAGKVPLVKAQLDPDDGEVRLRVDLPLGKDGLRDDDVLRGIQELKVCIEQWHAPLMSAMTAGAFEPPPRPPIITTTSATAPLMDIARRAGGINRLKVLFEFRKTLEREQNNHRKENNDGDHVE